MQKVLRINTNAQKQAIKESRKVALRIQKSREKEHHNWKHRFNAEINKHVKDERKARREDWLAGPLAPDRDTGALKGKYGSMKATALQFTNRPASALPKGYRPHWGNKHNLMVGDRAVVVKGRCQGQIGEITDIDWKKGSVTLQGIGTVDMNIPATSPKEMLARKITPMSIPFDLEDIRLVVQMKDTHTGNDVDVIARYLEGGDPTYEREYGSNVPTHTRYFAGTQIEIPWQEEEIDDYDRQEGDTPRKYVDEVTYVPQLLNAPVPASVAAELEKPRNHARGRHTDEYVARKIIEDARSIWYAQRRLITPTQQALEQQARQRREAEIERNLAASQTPL